MFLNTKIIVHASLAQTCGKYLRKWLPNFPLKRCPLQNCIQWLLYEVDKLYHSIYFAEVMLQAMHLLNKQHRNLHLLKFLINCTTFTYVKEMSTPEQHLTCILTTTFRCNTTFIYNQPVNFLEICYNRPIMSINIVKLWLAMSYAWLKVLFQGRPTLLSINSLE